MPNIGDTLTVRYRPHGSAGLREVPALVTRTDETTPDVVVFHPVADGPHKPETFWLPRLPESQAADEPGWVAPS